MAANTDTNSAARTAKAILLIRILVGWVFVPEGIQKFLFPDALGVGRLVKIGIPWPQVMAPFVGVVGNCLRRIALDRTSHASRHDASPDRHLCCLVPNQDRHAYEERHMEHAARSLNRSEHVACSAFSSDGWRRSVVRGRTPVSRQRIKLKHRISAGARIDFFI
jgi:hypothetical protein